MTVISRVQWHPCKRRALGPVRRRERLSRKASRRRQSPGWALKDGLEMCSQQDEDGQRNIPSYESVSKDTYFQKRVG